MIIFDIIKTGDHMKQVKKVYKKLINNRFIEWLIYMIGYAIVLITVSVLFSSFEINNQ